MSGILKDCDSKMTFATALNCMDGRTQLPLINWIKDRFEVDFVDMVTEPGIVKYLSSGDEKAAEEIRKKVEISVAKHGSRVVVVAAHHDCAGNPVDREVQIEQLRNSVEAVRSWNLGVDVIGVWIDEKWEPQEIVS